jgi:hypothetical protein
MSAAAVVASGTEYRAQAVPIAVPGAESEQGKRRVKALLSALERQLQFPRAVQGKHVTEARPLARTDNARRHNARTKEHA